MVFLLGCEGKYIFLSCGSTLRTHPKRSLVDYLSLCKVGGADHVTCESACGGFEVTFQANTLMQLTLLMLLG